MQTSEYQTGLMSSPKRGCVETNTSTNGSAETLKKTMKTLGKDKWDTLKYYVKKRCQYVVFMLEKLDILLLQGNIRYEY